MNEPTLQIFNESSVSIPLDQVTAHKILSLVEKQEHVTFEFVEVVYVTENEIVRINKEHLNRDYLTDIISFRYDEDLEEKDKIEGTLFCCAPRIAEQAEEFGEPADKEFKRILIHGLLHLTGYDDQSKEEKNRMTELENKYLDQVEQNN
jgi:rRNA maturation RNase YbeY